MDSCVGENLNEKIGRLSGKSLLPAGLHMLVISLSATYLH